MENKNVQPIPGKSASCETVEQAAHDFLIEFYGNIYPRSESLDRQHEA